MPSELSLSLPGTEQKSIRLRDVETKKKRTRVVLFRCDREKLASPGTVATRLNPSRILVDNVSTSFCQTQCIASSDFHTSPIKTRTLLTIRGPCLPIVSTLETILKSSTKNPPSQSLFVVELKQKMSLCQKLLKKN